MSKQTEITEMIMIEYSRACYQHPRVPEDIIVRAAIVAEEAGELVQAALNNVYHDGSRDAITTEALHTIVTCIRLIEGEL